MTRFTAPITIPLCLVAFAISSLTGTVAGMEEKEKTTETYAVLSTHVTEAVFKGKTERPCRFRTAQCPDRCNHGGTAAQFTITRYIKYDKPGKYGDPKTKEFTIMLKSPEMDKATINAINALDLGTPLKLSWEHRYVTRTSAGGFSSKFPRRVITLLKKSPPTP